MEGFLDLDSAQLKNDSIAAFNKINSNGCAIVDRATLNRQFFFLWPKIIVKQQKLEKTEEFPYLLYMYGIS